jgi:hypothetical protein
VLSACYRPAAIGECAAACAHDIDCPGELACGGDGLCRDRDALDCHDRPTIDASPDIGGDIGPVCFGGDGISKLAPMFCASSVPPHIDVTSFNTDTGCSGPGFAMWGQNAGPPVCIVYAGTISVDSPSARITGSIPLVLASAGTITITGGLSVASSQQPQVDGAGASFTGCRISPGNADTSASGSGAPGGSFRGIGGAGGSSPSKVGVAAAPTLAQVDFIRGGCAGGPGGIGKNGAAGTGGASGGAVYMIAKDSIVISGTVDASGAGGSGTVPSQGGNGGGSGGLVGLEAPAITIGAFATVVVLGGGGAAGGSQTANGAAGGDAVGMGQALGGTATMAGPGGNGSAVLSPGNAEAGHDTGAAFAGGGGGGGGGGFIVTLGALTNQGILVPAP